MTTTISTQQVMATLAAEGYDRDDITGAIDSFVAIDWRDDDWTDEDVQVLRDQIEA